MRKLDAIKAMLLSATIYGALTNPEKHKEGEDCKIDFKFPDENELGEPAVTLTMNLKSLSYVAGLLTAGRLATGRATIEKIEPTQGGKTE